MLVVGNLLWYMYAENYQNRTWFDKVVAKIKWCSFFDSRGRYVKYSSVYH